MKKLKTIQSDTKFKSLFFNIKNYNYSKSFIATLFLIIGIGLTLTFQTFAHDSKLHHEFRELSQDKQFKIIQRWVNQMNHFMHDYKKREFKRYYNDFDPFFYDPFYQIRINNNQIHREFQREFQKYDSFFEDDHKNRKINYNKSNKISINKREDNKYIIFDLKFKNFDKNDIKIKVKNGILTFYSKKEEKSDIKKDNSQRQYISSSKFNHSFSLPRNIDQNPIIDKGKDKIIVKFKKYNI